MADCKDCIKNDVCELYVHLHCKDYKENKCKFFKNKADFVEVVRCEKCKYGDVSTISKAKDGQEEIACYCNLKNRVTDIDSYCPSGKRK